MRKRTRKRHRSAKMNIFLTQNLASYVRKKKKRMKYTYHYTEKCYCLRGIYSIWAIENIQNGGNGTVYIMLNVIFFFLRLIFSHGLKCDHCPWTGRFLFRRITHTQPPHKMSYTQATTDFPQFLSEIWNLARKKHMFFPIIPFNPQYLPLKKLVNKKK